VSDIFISYAREDRTAAEDFARAFGTLGFSVWWDRDIPGGTEFATVIARELNDARVVVVLWSAPSTESGFVRDESTRALEAGKLLPVRIEAVSLPLGFGQIHTLDLLDWGGDVDVAAFQQLVYEIRQRLGQSSARPAPVRRWRLKPRLLALIIGPLVLAIAAYGGWRWHQTNQADSFFRQGLEQQFAREPNLEAARNLYLDAIELRPEHARTRYYLGHVYAQLGQRELARASFQLALVTSSGLDDGQREDAKTNLAALAPANEPAPLERAIVASGRPSLQPLKPEPSTDKEIKRPAADDAKKSAAAQTTTAQTTTAQTTTARPTISAIAKLATTTRPPQIPLAPESRKRVVDLVERMFGTEGEARIAATTTLVTSPDLLSDAVPIAVDEALARLAGGVNSMSAAAQSGVINTLVLLQSALPGTLSVNSAEIRRLLAQARPIGAQTSAQADRVQTLLDAAGKLRPRAFIQIANESQRPIAESLAVRLRAAGYDTGAIELSAERAPSRSAVRVQGRSDRGFARWLAKVAGEADGEVVAVQTLRNANPKIDTYEIWFDRDLCARGGRRLADCGD
jgi:tetratricopeptide (TPR) repeat protein